MKRYGLHGRRTMAFGVFLVVLLGCLETNGFGASIDYFGSVRQRLVTDGFDAARVNALYRDPKAAFEVRGISMYFVHSEGRLNYDQFLDPAMIRKARRYMTLHRETLETAERDFGVDPGVITAILLVETRLGTYVGNRRVINTFSTMAALSDSAVRDALWNAISGNTALSRDAFEAKALRKSSWAYDELKSFLRYTRRYNIDPLSVKGSYAGALGYCQFLPSNILKLGRDGNRDGHLDLFDHADAIASVASYLKHHGWRPGLSDQKAADVVYTYNHSRYYVNTVLKITKKLEG
ncbi:lytic murein transglycosylase [Desulfococcus multivorans]|uniref:MltB n=1 Tax=Desulfococcus multivorans DSM 2059 TaxID=1121405 RepID=S7U208_DESML|nr:lytic murein transglycosylase [Desulfococcus multivorans]AQV00871.1 protein MltB [Desulfococcus multivorans]EPR43347.1 MltB [Desulfococcus multivorans DSM 2059]SJZ43429.1 membrane-bound lytic murein transglycosylase B [Desulfococcus multivorans DSM 2059]